MYAAYFVGYPKISEDYPKFLEDFLRKLTKINLCFSIATFLRTSVSANQHRGRLCADRFSALCFDTNPHKPNIFLKAE